MAELTETPSASRTRISFFGLRNAGKSTLVNALAGQTVSIVSPVAGTTTDPVSKAMELAPLGPCLLTDTAGLGDTGELGAQRVARTRAVLEATDLAVWVRSEDDAAPFASFSAQCASFAVPVVVYARGETLASLVARLAAALPAETPPPIVADLVAPGDIVVLVCPQDGAAPKGRLILPQQQTLRELLDAHAVACVCQPDGLAALLARVGRPRLVVTDSQAFAEVAPQVPEGVALISFSILLARAKGDLPLLLDGVRALSRLKDGDRILVAEGCTHRRQCGDIGTVKLPAAIRAFAKCEPVFDFVSGGDFPSADALAKYALIVHCGGCMLSRRTVLNRLARGRAAGVPVTNYGLVLAACKGVTVDPEALFGRKGK